MAINPLAIPYSPAGVADSSRCDAPGIHLGGAASYTFAVAANHVQHPALLERDRELALLRASIEAARDGQGAVLLVEAPAGLGKTGLLRAAIELAGARSLRVLLARGGELERDLAYGLVRQLFERTLSGRGRRGAGRVAGRSGRPRRRPDRARAAARLR
jgi:hypothetical protein